MNKKPISSIAVLAAILISCGSGGGSGDGDPPLSASPFPTRSLTGTMTVPAEANLSKTALDVGVCGDITPEICRVAAFASDGSTVIDEDLADCRFELRLVVGKSYLINFVKADRDGGCNTFAASFTPDFRFITVDKGGDLDLGRVFFNVDGTVGSEAPFGLLGKLQSASELSLQDDNGNGIPNDLESNIKDLCAGYESFAEAYSLSRRQETGD